MKLFLKIKKYESEITPRARVAIVSVMSDYDQVTRRLFIFRTPFKSFRRYIDPWSFRSEFGWCTYTCAIIYIVKGKKIRWDSRWDPLDPSDWI